MIGLIQKGFQFSRRVSDDKVPVYAGQATLFIIFSVFPFIMLLLTLIQYISPLSQADLVSMLNGLVPDYLNNLVNSIVDELYTCLLYTSKAALISHRGGHAVFF